MMSTVSGEIRLGERDAPTGATRGLSPPATVYFAAVVAATIAAAALPVSRLDTATKGWTTFLILASCAATAQLFVVRTTRNQSYHASTVFLIAGALLLPPELVALMAVVQHIPEWLKARYAWYIQTFNICNYTLNGLAAWGTARLVMQHPPGGLSERPTWALAGLAACVVFVVMHHAILAGMLYLARGHRLGETGLFSIPMLSTEFVLSALGIGVAAFWQRDAWLVPFAVAPLLLIHRSLHVPRLEEQARVDPKTGLFNARHFATVLTDELARGERFERPVSLIMADLDLLREINNGYGHLAGDAVLAGIADVFREQLRHYDIPARFGGEEFAILLPETPYEDALEIAERIRRAVAERLFEVDTSGEPLRVTISMGIATFPKHGRDPNELVHHADLAVYRAKLQGRNRVLGAGVEPLAEVEHTLRLAALPIEADVPRQPARATRMPVDQERRRKARPAMRGPRLFAVRGRLVALLAAVAGIGIAGGVLGMAFGGSTDLLGMLAVAALVCLGQVVAFELDDGSTAVAVVGAIAAAALFDLRIALALALTSALVEWSARRSPAHLVLFNVGTLTLAILAAGGVFAAGRGVADTRAALVVTAVAGGVVYYVVNTGLLSLAMALEGREPWFRVWHERLFWLLPHYVGYGFIAGALAVAYDAIGVLALAIAVIPLMVVRKTQAPPLGRNERNGRPFHDAVEAVRNQNVSLTNANRLLRERSTAAMESLSATIDARDSYTIGHSRRVQRLALGIGRELGLSPAELDVLGYAALFHDIGKLGVPDAVLLKPAELDNVEWGVMRRHPEDGARIIDGLGFLADAVPAIRHHHERYDGDGYPDGLSGEDIPLGARIIHVADALDTMLTSRIYRTALSEKDAMDELRHGSGTQFCPRCVRALEQAVRVQSGPSLELLAS
jgi:diguanylate cyclase (GGDEF)-like protein/putative nucleotidyltransferase with HDIG domain